VQKAQTFESPIIVNRLFHILLLIDISSAYTKNAKYSDCTLH
jgi:hypothetical protein